MYVKLMKEVGKTLLQLLYSMSLKKVWDDLGIYRIILRQSAYVTNIFLHYFSPNKRVDVEGGGSGSVLHKDDFVMFFIV